MDELDYAKRYFHVDDESFDLAIQALEKQIPLKIRRRSDCVTCSNCFEILSIENCYCHNRGQKISWG